MKVQIHKLFEFLLETTAAEPEAVLGFSLSTPPRLGDFLDELDPGLSLDWSNQSFLGLPALRRHVLIQAGLEGVCTEDDVLITAGAAEANFLAITQLLQPGDEIILESPGWPQPAVLAKAIGASIRILPRRESDGWRLNLEELASLVGEHTRLIFICNPNNPTGQLLNEGELRGIASIAAESGAYVISDEVYAGLEWGAARAPAFAALYRGGISTGSVSKALGLQGLRIGWLICRDPQVIADAVILRENSSEIMNIMGETIAEIALRPERYAAAITRARDEGLANLALLDEFIIQREELSWVRPAAGLIGLARLHLSIDGEELARRLLEHPYRTFLLPGSAYDSPQHIRLGVGGGESVQLEKGLDRLGQFLDDFRSR